MFLGPVSLFLVYLVTPALAQGYGVLNGRNIVERKGFGRKRL
jgi:hypothetical protein